MIANRLIQLTAVQPTLSPISTNKTLGQLRQYKEAPTLPVSLEASTLDDPSKVGQESRLNPFLNRLKGKKSSHLERFESLEHEGGCLLQSAALVYGGTAVKHDGSYLTGIWGERAYHELNYIELADKSVSSQASAQAINGLSLCMTGPWSENYYHWLIQQLPRLEIASKICRIEDIDHILVAEPVRNFQIESLMAYGIDKGKIVPVPWHVPLLTEELLLTTIPSANYNVSKWTIEFLRQVAPTRANRLPPIFLNRRPPDKRVIVNEEEVNEMLAQLGIRSIDPGKMSFQDQVEVFASAEFVTGVHGASFANSVYSKPGSLIVDLMPQNYTMPYVERLAEACSNRYTRILGREAGPLPGQAPVQDADIIVPVKRLKEEILKELRRSSGD